MTGGRVATIAAFAAAAAIAGIARWVLALVAAGPDRRLPWGTLLANLAGCALLGAISDWHGTARLIAGTAALGAFTTFSTFENETLALLERGAAGAALGNVSLSLVAGLVGVWAGQLVGRQL